MACADVMDPGGAFRERVPMANAVLVNLGDGRFADGSAAAGEAFARKAVHRGAAFGDVDNDGRVDAVVDRARRAARAVAQRLAGAPTTGCW